MERRILTLVLCATTFASACSPAAPINSAQTDFAVLWIQNAAEFRAVATQAYAEASRDLEDFVTDPAWSALPGSVGSAGLPPAIILDVDETVVSNYDFQLNHLPYSSEKHFLWSREYHAVPIPGSVEFIDMARASGVEVFFITNRACEEIKGFAGSCPQEESTLGDLREAGFDSDADHVLLAGEQPGWGKEKLTRRQYVAKTHRVIMLFGDDLGDFIECTRSRAVAPCENPATRASRHATLNEVAHLWGQGWYILPNPMHGSWTTVDWAK